MLVRIGKTAAEKQAEVLVSMIFLSSIIVRGLLTISSRIFLLVPAPVVISNELSGTSLCLHSGPMYTVTLLNVRATCRILDVFCRTSPSTTSAFLDVSVS